MDENGLPIKFEGEQENEEPGSAQEPNSMNMYLDENGKFITINSFYFLAYFILELVQII